MSEFKESQSFEKDTVRESDTLSELLFKVALPPQVGILEQLGEKLDRNANLKELMPSLTEISIGMLPLVREIQPYEAGVRSDLVTLNRSDLAKWEEAFSKFQEAYRLANELVAVGQPPRIDRKDELPQVELNSDNENLNVQNEGKGQYYKLDRKITEDDLQQTRVMVKGGVEGLRRVMQDISGYSEL